MIEYRRENKYIISNEQISIIKERLETLMEEDCHNSQGGYYIRSLYFDTPDDYFFRQVSDGNEEHTKFRVRIYNNSYVPIKVEKKVSYNGKKKKIVGVIDYKIFETILSKSNLSLNESSIPNEIVSELHRNVYAGQLLPKVIVEYKRVAFTLPFGNIRVTLDEDISSSTIVDSFLDREIDKICILPNHGVLEIKYDSFFPGYIGKSFNDLSLERISFSKYYLARELAERWR